MFDPDYRKAGWNRSFFAPKNSGPLNITTLALIIALALCGAAYLLIVQPAIAPEAYARVMQSGGAVTLDGARWDILTPYLGVGVIAVVVTWMVVAMAIRTLAWRAVRPGSEPAASVPPPIPQSFDFEIAPAHQLTPAQFEREVATLIARKTGLRTVVTGGAGDRGVDIRVLRGERLVGIVQCKRYTPAKALPPMFVREMATVMQMQGVSIGYLVTTGQFSRESRTLADDLGVRLIDGPALEKMRSMPTA